MTSAINILVSCCHGIYVPQAFVEGYDLSLWNGIDAEDIETIQAGPEHEWYWDSWNDILNSASYSLDGRTYRLHQDDDLFAICDELMTDEEYENFFGEART